MHNCVAHFSASRVNLVLKNQFPELNWHILTSSKSILLFGVTYWALLEMLLQLFSVLLFSVNHWQKLSSVAYLEERRLYWACLMLRGAKDPGQICPPPKSTLQFHPGKPLFQEALGDLASILVPWFKSQNPFILFLNITNISKSLIKSGYLSSNLIFLGLIWPLRSLGKKKVKGTKVGASSPWPPHSLVHYPIFLYFLMERDTLWCIYVRCNLVHSSYHPSPLSNCYQLTSNCYHLLS